MQSSLGLTLREAVRYRGLWGHWSWIAHRLSGVGILLFLIIHVWDTANATFWPEAYSYTVELFKWLPFSIGEIGLGGCGAFPRIQRHPNHASRFQARMVAISA